MKRYTESQLWEFIGRADTHKKVRVAEDFITGLDYLDFDVWNDMMIALSQISRELYRMN